VTTVRRPAAGLTLSIDRRRPATAVQRTATLGVLAILSVAATLLVTAASASAQTWVGDTQLKNGFTDRCLSYTDWRSPVSDLVWSYNCKDHAKTDWGEYSWRDRTYQLRAIGGPAGTGRKRCLDDSYRHGLRAFMPCWPGSSRLSRYQSWYRDYVVHNGFWGFTYRNQATRRCLDDSNEYGLRTYPCNGLIFQNFQPGWHGGAPVTPG
jgi:hypothetical protein